MADTFWCVLSIGEFCLQISCMIASISDLSNLCFGFAFLWGSTIIHCNGAILVEDNFVDTLASLGSVGGVSQPLECAGCFKLLVSMNCNEKFSALIEKRLVFSCHGFVSNLVSTFLAEALNCLSVGNETQGMLSVSVSVLLEASLAKFLCLKNHRSGCKERPLNFHHGPEIPDQQKDPKSHQDQPWWMHSTRR